jgi:hypothetical protein
MADAEVGSRLTRSAFSGRTLVLLWGGMSILVAAVLFGVFAWRDRVQTFEEARLRTINMTELLAEHARRLFETGELVLGQTIRLAGPPDQPIPSSREAWEDLVQIKATVPYVISIWLGDSEGDAILTTREFPAPALNAADRDYYRVPRDNPDALYIGLTSDNRYANVTLINMSRRLESPPDGFRGFAQVSLSPDYIRTLYEQLGIGYDAIIWMMRGDMTPLLRAPAIDHELMQSALLSDNFGQIRGRRAGTLQAISPIAQTERLLAFRRVACGATPTTGSRRFSPSRR